MKIKNLIGGFLLASCLGLGVAAGISAHESKGVEEAKADTVSSRLIVKLGNLEKWSDKSAKLCACLTNDAKTVWTSLQTISSSQEMYVFDYTVDFAPTKLIWVRMNPAATSGNWDQKWNQTGDLALGDATYLQDQWDPSASQCSQWSITGNVYTSADGFVSPKVSMKVDSVEIVNGNQPQVHGQVTLAKDEQFKVVNVADDTWSGYYGVPPLLDSLTDPYFSGGSKEQAAGSSNIVCEKPGTYDFYFNTETKRTWITRQDVVIADGYASYFLENVGCDESGKTAPSGWSTVESEFAGLDNAAKKVLVEATANVGGDNIGQCVYWYDYARAAHSGLTAFMQYTDGESAIHVRSSIKNSYSIFNGEINNTTLAIIIIGSVSVASISAYFLLKKKKHN